MRQFSLLLVFRRPRRRRPPSRTSGQAADAKDDAWVTIKGSIVFDDGAVSAGRRT